jgi:hypothetical protein
MPLSVDKSVDKRIVCIRRKLLTDGKQVVMEVLFREKGWDIDISTPTEEEEKTIILLSFSFSKCV